MYAQGQLDPNVVFTPGNEVEFPAPAITVRYYFLDNSDLTKAAELATGACTMNRPLTYNHA
eukprot:COSAG01_NODE_66195_length_271_cov_0.563953_2_plen_61_part_00